MKQRFGTLTNTVGAIAVVGVVAYGGAAKLPVEVTVDSPTNQQQDNVTR